ncbi:hypothetical protein BpHYR1_014924 [Brachionus plicatilis]|uniref:Uncharacterized protein n=1 Tax=Brachionus plicatilis TaxID=10195 RepID=A0A3M7RF37_BRAPC|nr:hypothetical protein BpHYR1_014924 [Brachionus plicatilis]
MQNYYLMKTLFVVVVVSILNQHRKILKWLHLIDFCLINIYGSYLKLNDRPERMSLSENFYKILQNVDCEKKVVHNKNVASNEVFSNGAEIW